MSPTAVTGLIVFALLLSASCFEEPAATSPERHRPAILSVTPSPIILPTGPLDPGHYVATTFQPSFTLLVREQGWQVVEPQTVRYTALTWRPARSGSLFPPILSFQHLSEVYVYAGGGRRVEPVPDDLYRFLISRPHFSVLAMGTMDVGGDPTSFFEAEVVSAPPGSPVLETPSAEVPRYILAPLGETEVWLPVGERIRLLVTEAEAGSVLIGIEAATDDFAQFLPRARRLLEKVEFDSGGP